MGLGDSSIKLNGLLISSLFVCRRSGMFLVESARRRLREGEGELVIRGGKEKKAKATSRVAPRIFTTTGNRATSSDYSRVSSMGASNGFGH